MVDERLATAARDAEGPGEPAQARPLLAGVPGAILARKALLCVGGHSVAGDVLACAMSARDLNRDRGGECAAPL